MLAGKDQFFFTKIGPPRLISEGMDYAIIIVMTGQIASTRLQTLEKEKGHMRYRTSSTIVAVMMKRHARLCTLCGLPLTYSGYSSRCTLKGQGHVDHQRIPWCMEVTSIT